jgi:hypothetical protein
MSRWAIWYCATPIDVPQDVHDELAIE